MIVVIVAAPQRTDSHRSGGCGGVGEGVDRRRTGVGGGLYAGDEAESGRRIDGIVKMHFVEMLFGSVNYGE